MSTGRRRRTNTPKGFAQKDTAFATEEWKWARAGRRTERQRASWITGTTSTFSGGPPCCPTLRLKKVLNFALTHEFSEYGSWILWRRCKFSLFLLWIWIWMWGVGYHFVWLFSFALLKIQLCWTQENEAASVEYGACPTSGLHGCKVLFRRRHPERPPTQGRGEIFSVYR